MILKSKQDLFFIKLYAIFKVQDSDFETDVFTLLKRKNMKKMKKMTWMVLIAMLAMSCTLEAQNNTRGRRDRRVNPRTEYRWTAKDRTDFIAKELELTAEQVTKVQALFEKQDAERAEQVAAHRARRDQAMGNREVRRKEMQEAREKAVAKQDTELEKIIGKEKTERWKKLREERQKVFRDANRQGRRSAPGRR